MLYYCNGLSSDGGPVSGVRQATGWMMRHPDQLGDEERQQLSTVLIQCPELTRSTTMAWPPSPRTSPTPTTRLDLEPRALFPGGPAA
ncbi:hypothetical protein [Streptomyces atratus]|uniref:hypothetical protein n=1 Tax=Streptomyces atratus TaxID=1893 RepID=UPI0016707BF5|nr:hypothetical protein [Streptomyces atratus]